MIAVLKKEIGEYFNGLLGYVFSAFLLLFAGIYVTIYNLRQGYANFEYVLSSLSFLLIIAVPLLTMRTFAEERRNKTEQLLFSLPISATQIVIGKFLAMVLVILIPVSVLAAYPLVLDALGTVNLATAYSTLLAFFLLALLLASIGMLLSALCENQIVSAGMCFTVLLILYFGKSLSSYITASFYGTLLAVGCCMMILGVAVGRTARNLWAGVLSAVCPAFLCLLCALRWRAAFSQLLVVGVRELAVFHQFFSFVDGMLDFRILYYYISLTIYFLFLTVRVLEKRRWNG